MPRKKIIKEKPKKNFKANKQFGFCENPSYYYDGKYGKVFVREEEKCFIHNGIYYERPYLFNAGYIKHPVTAVPCRICPACRGRYGAEWSIRCWFESIQYDNNQFITLTYSWSANNGVKTFIHSVLQEAVRKGLIERNYASKEFLRPVTGTKGQKIILENKDEISQFVDCLKKEKDLRKKAAFACYLYLGLRNAEVAGLAWKNIYLEKQEIVISQNTIYAKGLGAVTKDTKTKNSMRILTMPQALTDILSEYKVWWEHEKTMTGDLWANTDKLFVQYNGKDMCGNTLAGWLKEWEKANGLKQVTPHGLRHTNITYQIMNDIDIKTVSARAGHADIQTTLNIYSHFVHEADRRAANKINELFDTKND